MSSLPKFVQKDIPTDKLEINPDNIRLRKGVVVDGIKVQDTYNLGTMKDIIRTLGGIPDRLTVEEMLRPDGKTKFYRILAGNRRGAAAMEMLQDQSNPAELLEKLKSLPCNVYVDLTDRQRRDLINDQRSQKYMRSELDVYIWKLQSSGMTFPEIASFVWQQMATYTGGGAKKIMEIERCGSDADRQKVINTWLKGTLDTIILTCGKMGPRVRRALFLTDAAIDDVSPILGYNDKNEPIYELAEFKPTQGRCNELRKAMNNDPKWSADKGGDEFNALIAKYIRQDKGLDDNGEPIEQGPSRASAELLVEQLGRTHSNAAKVALRFARGEKPREFADVDSEAYRIQCLLETVLECRNSVKNPLVKELCEIFLTGDQLTLKTFLAGQS